MDYWMIMPFSFMGPLAEHQRSIASHCDELERAKAGPPFPSACRLVLC